ALPPHRVEFGGMEQLHQLREKVSKDLATLEEESERKAKEVKTLSDEVAKKENELVAV
ncbi:pyx, partial [Symbiodinium microadriaticum]